MLLLHMLPYIVTWNFATFLIIWQVLNRWNNFGNQLDILKVYRACNLLIILKCIICINCRLAQVAAAKHINQARHSLYVSYIITVESHLHVKFARKKNNQSLGTSPFWMVTCPKIVRHLWEAVFWDVGIRGSIFP